MSLVVIKQAHKELLKLPKEIKEDIFSLFEELSNIKMLSMPISRPLPGIGKGLHELRLTSRLGEFRVFYVIKPALDIYVIHAMQKKKQKIDKRTIDLIRLRLGNI